MAYQNITHTLDEQGPDVYDVAHWRPLQADKYLEAVGQATLTVDEPTSLVMTCAGLDDGRIRTVTWAYIKPNGPEAEGHESEMGPYLMTLYDPEAGRTVCLIRTNCYLAGA